MRSAFATKCLSLTVLAMAWLNTAAVITANASCVSSSEIVFQTEYCLGTVCLCKKKGGDDYMVGMD